MPSSGYLPSGDPLGGRVPDRAAPPSRVAEVRDEALLRVVAELHRTWAGDMAGLLSKMDRLTAAVELLAEARGVAIGPRPADLRDKAADAPPEGAPDGRGAVAIGPQGLLPGAAPWESAGPSARDWAPTERPVAADRGLLSTLRANYIQVVFGLAVGLIAVLVAFYLFTRAR